MGEELLKWEVAARRDVTGGRSEIWARIVPNGDLGANRVDIRHDPRPDPTAAAMEQFSG